MSHTRHFIALGALLVLSACHKDAGHPPAPPQPNAYIYLGGSVVTPSGAQEGIYFKNNISEIVANGTSNYDTLANAAKVSCMTVFDSTIYMAANTAGYWKGNTFIPVNGASGIDYLAINDNTIALAGFDNTFGLAYWINGHATNVMNTFNRTVYPNQGFMSYGFSGLALSGNKVAISGSYNMTDEPVPGATTADTSTQPGLYETVWLNGNIQILYHDYWNVNIDYTSTVGVAFLGNDIYIPANRTSDSGKVNGGGYYKNGDWTSINNGNFWPNSVYASATDVYIAGYTYTFPPFSNFKAAYCKNGNLISFDGIATKAITTSGPDLYILGIDDNANYVVWKNGTIIETLGSASTLDLNSIAIAK